MIVINNKTLQHGLVSLDDIKLSRIQAEAVYRLLMQIGAAEKTDLILSDDGSCSVRTWFKYPISSDEECEGTQYSTLGQFIARLVRFDRSANRRMKNVNTKIAEMHKAITKLEKQL